MLESQPCTCGVRTTSKLITPAREATLSIPPVQCVPCVKSRMEKYGPATAITDRLSPIILSSTATRNRQAGEKTVRSAITSKTSKEVHLFYLSQNQTHNLTECILVRTFSRSKIYMRKAREREFGTLDENQRAVGILTLCAIKKKRHKPGGRRDNTCDRSLSRRSMRVKHPKLESGSDKQETTKTSKQTPVFRSSHDSSQQRFFCA